MRANQENYLSAETLAAARGCVPTAWLCCMLWIRVHKHKGKRKAVGIALLAPSALRGVDKEDDHSSSSCTSQQSSLQLFSPAFLECQRLGGLTRHSWPVPRFHITLPALIHGASMIYLIPLSKAFLLASWLNSCICSHPKWVTNCRLVPWMSGGGEFSSLCGERDQEEPCLCPATAAFQGLCGILLLSSRGCHSSVTSCTVVIFFEFYFDTC